LLHAALLTLALLIAAMGTARAHTEQAIRQFRSGSSSFQAGDYAKALAAFEQALAEGMSGPAIHFNIGVAAYRVGKHERAEAAFNEVARTPAMAGLAYYNLGLVALARGDSTTAAQWFARAELQTDDEKLRELASSRLSELRPPSREARWFGYAGFGLGHDDNVALVSNSNVLGISDSADNFAEAQLAMSTPLSDSWRIDGGLFLVDYQKLDSFDQLGANAGARYRWRLGDWNNDAGARLSYSALDGSGLENRRTLSLQTNREVLPDLRVRGRYRFHHLDGLNEFEGLSGRQQEWNARLDWTATMAWAIGFQYQYEDDDYDDATLSAKRHQLSMDVEHEIGADWLVAFEATHRHSDFDIERNGREQRTDLALTVTRTLTSRWRLIVRHAYTDNQAELREFDYRGNRISAGIEATL
jgi:tetratricopeptide (TPR) repeat protein